MTETKSAPRRTSRSKGLHVERIFSTEGVHPYDEVTWERRDVVQTNWRTGDVVFEQRGVEFPDFHDLLHLESAVSFDMDIMNSRLR